MIQGENNHLFVRQGVGLQGQAVFRTKLSFRPHSTDSFTHRKITLSLADKSQKTHKIRVLPNVGQDPEAHRSEMIKKEEDRLKASIRRENKIRRTRERAHSRGPSASYLEPDQYDDDDEDGISLSAIKNKFKRKEFASATYSDSDDGSDLEIGRKSSDKKKQARIQESDDDDWWHLSWIYLWHLGYSFFYFFLRTTVCYTSLPDFLWFSLFLSKSNYQITNCFCLTRDTCFLLYILVHRDLLVCWRQLP